MRKHTVSRKICAPSASGLRRSSFSQTLRKLWNERRPSSAAFLTSSSPGSVEESADSSVEEFVAGIVTDTGAEAAGLKDGPIR
jgi:hypothetical protein